MAFPTAVNDQITDAVTQANVKVLGVGLAMLNTVAAQQQLNIIAEAVVTRGAANQLSTPRLPASPPAGKPSSAASPVSAREQAKGARSR